MYKKERKRKLLEEEGTQTQMCKEQRDSKKFRNRKDRVSPASPLLSRSRYLWTLGTS